VVVGSYGSYRRAICRKENLYLKKRANSNETKNDIYLYPPVGVNRLKRSRFYIASCRAKRLRHTQQKMNVAALVYFLEAWGFH